MPGNSGPDRRDRRRGEPPRQGRCGRRPADDNIGLLDEDGDGVGPGDWVLIHVGFAISQVDEEEAIATRRQLERMGENYEAELEELKASVIE